MGACCASPDEGQLKPMAALEKKQSATPAQGKDIGALVKKKEAEPKIAASTLHDAEARGESGATDQIKEENNLKAHQEPAHLEPAHQEPILPQVVTQIEPKAPEPVHQTEQAPAESDDAPVSQKAPSIGSQEQVREPSIGDSNDGDMMAFENNSEASGMMQMADDQSEVSGMMKMAEDDESDVNAMQDLGSLTKAPVIKDRASDDSAHDLGSLIKPGSQGHDFMTAKQKARQFNALSVTSKVRPDLSFGNNMNDKQFGSASDGGSDEGQMQMDNESEASGLMQMADDDGQSDMGGDGQ